LHLQAITIKGWRNYTGEKISFLPGINLFMGNNGQGKTNLLEAVYFLSSGRSPRTSRTEELIGWQEKYFYLAGRVQRGKRVTNIEMGAARDGRRAYKADGVAIQRLSDIANYVNAVFFMPEDLYLVKGGPALRRRFLDYEISQIDSSYRFVIGKYNNYLRQRNALLKSKDQDKLVKNVLTEKLAELSGPIVHKRQAYLQRLSILARLKHRKLSYNKEELSLVYKASVNPGLSTPEVLELFQKSQGLEHRYKSTMVGPHRDDFSFIVNGCDLRTFGSQGQQRTAVLSVKLAEVDLFKGETGEYPLLLLDDVFSELDASRKAMLLEDLSGRVQTFISSVEASTGSGFGTFWIEAGKIKARE
jgi:DNA replication and repair protein RecF